MKKLIPILLLAVALGDQCFAQTVTDGLTVTGGPAVVGTDPSPGGAQLLRVGGSGYLNSSLTANGVFSSDASTSQGRIIPGGGVVVVDARNSVNSAYVPLYLRGSTVKFDTSPVVVGTDPGGSELLRVGGAVKANQYLGTGVDGAQLFRGTWQNAIFRARYVNDGVNHMMLEAANGTENNYIPLTIGATGLRIPSATSVSFGTDPTPNNGELLRVGGSVKAKQYVSSGSDGEQLFRGTWQNGILRIRYVNDGVNHMIIESNNAAETAYLPMTLGATALRVPSATGVVFGTETGTSDLLRVGGSAVCKTTNTVLGGPGTPAYFKTDNTVNGGKIWRCGNTGSTSSFNTFDIYNQSDNLVVLSCASNGNIGVGTGDVPPANKLTVIGTISAKEIKVTTSGADYVFENDYKLRSLAEVESFIAEHKHLPEMMSAKAMQADGMPVSEVVTKQLAKIEELTLYAIQAQKDRDAAQAVAKATQAQVAAQEARIQRLENLIRNLAPAAVP